MYTIDNVIHFLEESQDALGEAIHIIQNEFPTTLLGTYEYADLMKMHTRMGAYLKRLKEHQHVEPGTQIVFRVNGMSGTGTVEQATFDIDSHSTAITYMVLIDYIQGDPNVINHKMRLDDDKERWYVVIHDDDIVETREEVKCDT